MLTRQTRTRGKEGSVKKRNYTKDQKKISKRTSTPKEKKEEKKGNSISIGRFGEVDREIADDSKPKRSGKKKKK